MTVTTLPPSWDDPQVRWDDPDVSWDGLTAPWDLLHYLTINGVPWAGHVTEITIRHGRDGATGQPASAVLTATLAPTPASEMNTLMIGQAVTLDVRSRRTASGDLYGTYPRFRGSITDIDWDQESLEGTIIAADVSGDLAALYVGEEPWAQQTDVDRARTIIAAVGLNPDDPAVFRVVGNPLATMLPRDVDRQPAWDLLASLADETTGVVWVASDGAVCFATGSSREDPAEPLAVPTDQVLMELAWATTSDFTNKITVDNGTTAAVSEDPASIGQYGLRETSTSAAVIDGSLQTIADRRLVSGAEPRWALPEVTWLSDIAGHAGMIPDPFAGIMALQVGDRITFDGPTPPSPVPFPPVMHVEGWSERHLPGRMELTWSIVDHELFLTPPPPVTNLRTSRVDADSFTVTFTLPGNPNVDGAAYAVSKAYYPEDPTAATFVSGTPGQAVSVQVDGNPETTVTYVSVWSHNSDGLWGSRQVTTYIGMPSQQVTITQVAMVRGSLRVRLNMPNDPAASFVRLAKNRNAAVPDPPGSYVDIAAAPGQAVEYTFGGGIGDRGSDCTMYAAAWVGGPGGVAPLAPSRGQTFALRTPVRLGVSGRNAYGATGGWEGQNRVRHGNTSSNTYRGTHVYGTQIADILAGRIITAIDMMISRKDGGPGGAMTVRLGTHAETGFGGRPNIGDQFDIGNVARFTNAWYRMPDVNGSYARLSSGALRGYGFIWDAADVNRTYVGQSGLGGDLAIYHNDYA